MKYDDYKDLNNEHEMCGFHPNRKAVDEDADGTPLCRNCARDYEQETREYYGYAEPEERPDF